MRRKKNTIQAAYITIFRVLKEKQGGTKLEVNLEKNLEFKIC
jgi:hypothetical protein